MTLAVRVTSSPAVVPEVALTVTVGVAFATVAVIVEEVVDPLVASSPA